MLVAWLNTNPVQKMEVSLRRFERGGITMKGAILNAIEKKALAFRDGCGGYYQYANNSE